MTYTVCAGVASHVSSHFICRTGVNRGVTSQATTGLDTPYHMCCISEVIVFPSSISLYFITTISEYFFLALAAILSLGSIGGRIRRFNESLLSTSLQGWTMIDARRRCERAA